MKTEVDDETLVEVALTLKQAEEKIKSLNAKVKRLQDARLAKYAAMAMQGMLMNVNAWEITEDKIAEYSIKQAKALIAALDDEKGE